MADKCTPQRKQKCKKSAGASLEAVCQQCERRVPYETSLRFDKGWFLMMLVKAHYPFSKNDLTMDEWLLIGEMSNAYEQTVASE